MILIILSFKKTILKYQAYSQGQPKIVIYLGLPSPEDHSDIKFIHWNYWHQFLRSYLNIINKQRRRTQAVWHSSCYRSLLQDLFILVSGDNHYNSSILIHKRIRGISQIISIGTLIWNTSRTENKWSEIKTFELWLKILEVETTSILRNLYNTIKFGSLLICCQNCTYL